MQRITKVLVGVVGVGALLGLLVGGAVLWLIHRVGPAIVDSAKSVHSDGARAGSSLTDSACLATSLDRLRANRINGAAGILHENLWLTGCLQTSQLDDELCRAVPPTSSPLQVGFWAGARCNALGLGGNECSTLLQRVAEYCSSPERRKKAAPRVVASNPGVQRTRFARR